MQQLILNMSYYSDATFDQDRPSDLALRIGPCQFSEFYKI
jgi:hypothetical protein